MIPDYYCLVCYSTGLTRSLLSQVWRAHVREHSKYRTRRETVLTNRTPLPKQMKRDYAADACEIWGHFHPTHTPLLAVANLRLLMQEIRFKQSKSGSIANKTPLTPEEVQP